MVTAAAIIQGAKTFADSKGGQSFLGGLGTGIGSLFGRSGKASAKAAQQQYQYNLALQKQAQEWNEYMYKHRYQFQVDDLEAAGINKLYGLGTAPSVTSGLNSTGMADYVGEQNNKAQQFLSALDLGQNLSARRAQEKLIEQQTNTERVNTNLKIIEQEGKILDNQYKRLENENLPKKQRAEIENTIANTKKNITSAKKDIEETQSIQLKNAKDERIQRWHEQHPGWSNLITGVGELSNSIMTGLAIGGGGAAVASKLNKKSNSARKRISKR